MASRHGHWYVGMRMNNQRVEMAVPSVLSCHDAICVAEHALYGEGWRHMPGDITWRADFSHRRLASDQQPDYA